jgi:hypothetical protein
MNLKIAKIFAIVAIPVLAIVIIAVKSSEKETVKEEIKYTIEKTEESGGQITMRLYIDKKTEDKEQLISIAKKMKENVMVKDQFICFFYIKGSKLDYGAWARVAYLPECIGCENAKDEDGNGVEYEFVGLPKY